MDILIKLVTPKELILYEGMALALTLASFDHKVQLFVDRRVFAVLVQPSSRAFGMIQSLDLYDIAPAWIVDDEFGAWFLGGLAEDLRSQFCLCATPVDSAGFVQVLTF